MKKIIEAFGTGANAEEALNNAERELNAPKDADVTKEVVDIQEKKILGLFKSGTIYKARAYYEIEVKEDRAVKPDVSTPNIQKSEKKSPHKGNTDDIKKEKAAVTVSSEAQQALVAPTGIEENGPVQDYIKNILKGLGIENVKIYTEKTEDSIYFRIISEEDYGCVIGRRGETLDALQYLTRLVVNRGDVEYKRVTVNIGNYREKRTQTLTALAKKHANKVLKYGRSFTFEPMNPFERRVIHTTIQEIENVESYSIGNDDHRRVVIRLVDGAKPTNPSSPRRNSGRRPAAQQRKSAPVQSNTATPKSDFSGANLYGKIEPKSNS